MKKAEKMRVGYILKMFPRFSETFIMNEILELERRGVDITVFSVLPPTDGRFHSQISGLRAKVIYLPPHSYSEFWRNLRSSLDWLKKRKKGYSRALWHALECSTDSALKYFIRAGFIAEWTRKLRLNHLHSHFASSPTHIAMYTSMMTNIPYSFIAHAKDIYHHSVDWKLFRDLVKHASFTVTVSDANKNYISNRIGNLYSDKIHRLYNGLDLKHFNMNSTGRPENRILAVGRLVEKKGFSHLIKAMRILHNRGRKLECRIIGDGEERASLESQISENNLKRTVKLEGALPLDEVLARMKKATVLVLPAVIAKDGNRDALPTVLLEAMAVGLPVISTDVVGIPEVLNNGGCGLLIEQKNPAALAGAIETLLDDKILRSRLARAGRRKVEKDFNITKNVRRLHKLMAGSTGLQRNKQKARSG